MSDDEVARLTILVETRPLHVTRDEAELIMDNYPVRNPKTRRLALKAAVMVLAWEKDEAIRDALGSLRSSGAGA